MQANEIKVEGSIGGRNYSISTGLMAKQAAGAVLVQYGDTVVFSAASVGPQRPGVEVPIAPRVVVGLHRQVPVGQQAVGHHQVMGLVPVGSHLHVHLPRRREMHDEHDPEEQT